MAMLDGLNKNAVDFKPNYDGTSQEPITLPSKFPYILCGNNSGIAVGMSSDLVSHNFTEVMNAINYYLDKDGKVTIAELLNFIQGPDFPTGGYIGNGEDLLNIYTTGSGAVKVYAHYDVIKSGQKPVIIFHDLPYGVEIDSRIKTPLRKMVIEDGYDVFEDINVKKAGPRNFDIIITLSKNANVQDCINLLYQKTGLSNTVKINQTLIVNGEPRLLNLKDLIKYWVDYRSSIIKRIAQTDYDKTNHKLTVTIGLQKCLSDIDLLVKIIREADNRDAAKTQLKNVFTLNDEQADAVLDMKLSRLNRLDLTELNRDEKELENEIARLKRLITDEKERYNIIRQDLKDIKSVVGEDKRLTEVCYSRAVENERAVIKKEWHVCNDGIKDDKATSGLVAVVQAYGPEEVVIFSKDGTLNGDLIDGAFTIIEREKKNKIVSVTKSGNVKVSMLDQYTGRKNEKVMKLKDDDEVVFVAAVDDNDAIMLLDDKDTVLKLKISDLPIAGKTTLGVKSGLTNIINAITVNDSDIIAFVNKEGKGKLTAVKDFNYDNRLNKGQHLNEGIIGMAKMTNRSNLYLIGNTVIAVPATKMSLKSRTAIGAALTSRVVKRII